MRYLVFGINQDKKSLIRSLNSKLFPIKFLKPCDLKLRKPNSTVPRGHEVLLLVSCSTDTQNWLVNTASVRFAHYEVVYTDIEYNGEQVYLDLYWVVARSLNLSGINGDIWEQPQGNRFTMQFDIDSSGDIPIEQITLEVPAPFELEDGSTRFIPDIATYREYARSINTYSNRVTKLRYRVLKPEPVLHTAQLAARFLENLRKRS